MSGNSGARIVVIDDEMMILQLCTMLLEAEGFEVATASSLAAGRKRFAHESFELLLIDKNLPDGSGLELAAEAVEALKSAALTEDQMRALSR